MEGNDIATRTLELVTGGDDVEPTPQFNEEPVLDGTVVEWSEKVPEPSPYATYQSIKFIDVLGVQVPIEIAQQTFVDLGEALAAAQADA